jgi:hypothetical protein
MLKRAFIDAAVSMILLTRCFLRSDLFGKMSESSKRAIVRVAPNRSVSLVYKRLLLPALSAR